MSRTYENETVVVHEGNYRLVQRPNYVVGSVAKLCYVIQLYTDNWREWRDIEGPFLQKPAAIKHFERCVEWERSKNNGQHKTAAL